MANKLTVDDTATSGSMGTSGSQATGGVADTAKRAAEKVAEKVKETAAGKADQQRETVASGLSAVADAFRRVGDGLQDDAAAPIAGYAAGLGRTLGDQVDHVAHYLQNHDIREIISDTERFARRNPALFLGGAFTLGLALSRFLKSGRSADRYSYRGGYGYNQHAYGDASEVDDTLSGPGLQNYPGSPNYSGHPGFGGTGTSGGTGSTGGSWSTSGSGYTGQASYQGTSGLGSQTTSSGEGSTGGTGTYDDEALDETSANTRTNTQKDSVL